jgi:hypothetical protein
LTVLFFSCDKKHFGPERDVFLPTSLIGLHRASFLYPLPVDLGDIFLAALLNPEDSGIYSSEASVSAYKTTQCQPRRPQCGFSHLILDYIILPASEVSMMAITEVVFSLCVRNSSGTDYILCFVFHFRFLWRKEQNM